MEKQAAIIIGVIGVILAMILYWIFGGTQDEVKKQQQQTPTTTNTTPSQQTDISTGDASSRDLSAAENKSLKDFVRSFTQKYISYDQSKPTSNVDSVKDQMTTELYNEQYQNFKTPLAKIKNVEIKKIYITNIEVSERFTMVTTFIDVTVHQANGNTVDVTYQYLYNIINTASGWKVEAITDVSDDHE